MKLYELCKYTPVFIFGVPYSLILAFMMVKDLNLFRSSQKLLNWVPLIYHYHFIHYIYITLIYIYIYR